MSFMQGVYDAVRGKGAKVAYPEGLEERAIRAARWLVDNELVVPVLVGPEAGIREKAKALGVALDGVVVRDRATRRPTRGGPRSRRSTSSCAGPRA
jgi:phosphate acetyltransferase